MKAIKVIIAALLVTVLFSSCAVHVRQSPHHERHHHHKHKGPGHSYNNSHNKYYKGKPDKHHHKHNNKPHKGRYKKR